MPLDDNQVVDLFHDSLEPKDIHAPYSFIFNNQLERGGALVTYRDIGKLARQLDDGSIWLLWDTLPTWRRVLTEGTPTTPDGPAGGHLMKFYPNPEVRPDSHLHTPGVSIPEYPVTLPPNGPANGADIQGIYPANLELKPTGVMQGTYPNPIITVDEKGRVRQITSGINGEVNTAINMGAGTPWFIGKEGPILQFRSLDVEFNSGLSIELGLEENTLGAPGLAKLTGADFTGKVTAPDLQVSKLQVNSLFTRHLYQAGAGSNWVPLASNGSTQTREVTSSGMLSAISGAPVGMEFTFYINIGGNFTLQLDDEYLVDVSPKVLTQGMNILEGYVLTPFMYACKVTKLR